MAGRFWIELTASGSCVFAVSPPAIGNQISPVKDKETSLGDLDIAGILMQSFPDCGKSGEMEVRGMIQCNAFDLVFWVVGKSSFHLSTGDVSKLCFEFITIRLGNGVNAPFENTTIGYLVI
ncbi:hypothetical protein LY76DRAFT_632048 [Colletotrichum caudatum]|nr:hypothetical protein LY76DRAFT_632048 [Colletotrichum caudatum]